MFKNKIVLVDITCVTPLHVMAKTLSLFSIVLALPQDKEVHDLLMATPDVYRPDEGGLQDLESEKKIMVFLSSIHHRLRKGVSADRLVYRKDGDCEYFITCKRNWFLKNPLGELFPSLRESAQEKLQHLSGNPVGRDVLKSMAP